MATLFRKFSIISAAGTELSLTTEAIFASAPTGLGVELTNDITTKDGCLTRLGGAIDRTTPISFKIIFNEGNSRSPYENYFYFASFLKGGEVTLKYEVGNKVYYRDVVVESAELSEMTTNGALEEMVTFAPLTSWYTLVTATWNGVTNGYITKGLVLTGISLTKRKYRGKIDIYNPTGATIDIPNNTLIRWASRGYTAPEQQSSYFYGGTTLSGIYNPDGTSPLTGIEPGAHVIYDELNGLPKLYYQAPTYERDLLKNRILNTGGRPYAFSGESVYFTIQIARALRFTVTIKDETDLV